MHRFTVAAIRRVPRGGGGKSASEISHSIGFLRNKNAALPARAQKNPWTLSGLKKHGSRMAPAATNFRAPSECHGYRRTGWCGLRVYLFHARGWRRMSSWTIRSIYCSL